LQTLDVRFGFLGLGFEIITRVNDSMPSWCWFYHISQYWFSISTDMLNYCHLIL